MGKQGIFWKERTENSLRGERGELAASEIPRAAEEDGLAREGRCLLRLGWRYFLGRETFEERFFLESCSQNIQLRKRL